MRTREKKECQSIRTVRDISRDDRAIIIVSVYRPSGLLVAPLSASSYFVSFTQFCPTCGRMPLPALSLRPGRQPCRPRLVDGRRGGGPSSVAPRSRCEGGSIIADL